jgi:hypothetical protein
VDTIIAEKSVFSRAKLLFGAQTKARSSNLIEHHCVRFSEESF